MCALSINKKVKWKQGKEILSWIISLSRGDQEWKNSSVRVHFACLLLSHPGNDVKWESGIHFSLCLSNSSFHTNFIPSKLHCFTLSTQQRPWTISSIGLLWENVWQELMHKQVNKIFPFFLYIALRRYK